MNTECDTSCIIVSAILGTFAAVLIAVIIYFIIRCNIDKRRLKRINETLNITNDIPMDNIKTIHEDNPRHADDSDEYITVDFNKHTINL